MPDEPRVTRLQNVRVSYSVPLARNARDHRAIVEHGDGRFSIAVVDGQAYDKGRVVQVEPEATFTMESLGQLALAGLSGDPAISKNKNAGKTLAAGVLLFMAAMKLVETRQEPDG